MCFFSVVEFRLSAFYTSVVKHPNMYGSTRPLVSVSDSYKDIAPMNHLTSSNECPLTVKGLL